MGTEMTKLDRMQEWAELNSDHRSMTIKAASVLAERTIYSIREACAIMCDNSADPSALVIRMNAPIDTATCTCPTTANPFSDHADNGCKFVFAWKSDAEMNRSRALLNGWAV
jgi:hypothetical protein